jgi:hypothetical protein
MMGKNIWTISKLAIKNHHHVNFQRVDILYSLLIRAFCLELKVRNHLTIKSSATLCYSIIPFVLFKS